MICAGRTSRFVAKVPIGPVHGMRPTLISSFEYDIMQCISRLGNRRCDHHTRKDYALSTAVFPEASYFYQLAHIKARSPVSVVHKCSASRHDPLHVAIIEIYFCFSPFSPP